MCDHAEVCLNWTDPDCLCLRTMWLVSVVFSLVFDLLCAGLLLPFPPVGDAGDDEPSLVYRDLDGLRRLGQRHLLFEKRH